MKRRERGKRMRRSGEERKEEERGTKRIQVILPKADREWMAVPGLELRVRPCLLPH